MGWHEIALGAITALIAMGGWVWMQVIKKLGQISDKLDSHAAEDTRLFASVFEKMDANQVQLLTRIADRWYDKP